MQFPVFQIQEAHCVLSLCWASLSPDLCSLFPLPSQVFVHTGKIPLSFLFSGLSNPSCLSAPPGMTLLQVFNHHPCCSTSLSLALERPQLHTASQTWSPPSTCLGLSLPASLYSIRPFSAKGMAEAYLPVINFRILAVVYSLQFVPQIPYPSLISVWGRKLGGSFSKGTFLHKVKADTARGNIITVAIVSCIMPSWEEECFQDTRTR